jgi:hypothetical protein
MSGTAERVTDTDEAVAENTGVPAMYRRRLGRSYFTPPAVWCGPGDTVRERDRRTSRRW